MGVGVETGDGGRASVFTRVPGFLSFSLMNASVDLSGSGDQFFQRAFGGVGQGQLIFDAISEMFVKAVSEVLC